MITKCGYRKIAAVPVKERGEIYRKAAVLSVNCSSVEESLEVAMKNGYPKVSCWYINQFTFPEMFLFDEPMDNHISENLDWAALDEIIIRFCYEMTK